MNTHFKIRPLASIIFGVWFSAGPAASGAQPLGRTFDEVVKLAVKEGKVRVGSWLTADEAPVVLKGSKQKYPMVKVDITPVSGTARPERIFNEALAGVVEFDLYDIPAAMQNRFVKGGVLLGPIEWRKVLPDVPDIHFSPDGYFNASGFNLRIIGYIPL
jgi:hypothetical protein